MEKILVIKLGALGDIIMATSLIKQIQEYHHNDELWLLTAPGFGNIFECWDNLNIAAFKRSGIFNLIKTIIWIRKNRFDRIYDLQSNDRSSLLCALSTTPLIVGNHPRYPYNFHPPDKYTGQCHIYDRMLAVLGSAGIPTEVHPPFLPSSEADRRFVKNWLHEKQLLDKSLVIMHAGASDKHPEKCWPFFLDLAIVLEKRRCSIIWIGANKEADINKQYAQQAGVDATNVFTVNQLAELGRYACLAVTNDSGPMHILSASGIPVIAIFGPTNWQRNHAVGQADNIIAIKKNGDFESIDIKRISPDVVLSHLETTGLI